MPAEISPTDNWRRFHKTMETSKRTHILRVAGNTTSDVITCVLVRGLTLYCENSKFVISNWQTIYFEP